VEVKRGAVVLCVVSSDLGRPRPAIVVQADELVDELSTLFVCPVTSDVRDRLSLRPIIEPEPQNGLRLRSQIMTDKMVALRRDRIKQTIGQISPETLELVGRALLVMLGLAR
jgi:mRNA interferase MazF